MTVRAGWDRMSAAGGGSGMRAVIAGCVSAIVLAGAAAAQPAKPAGVREAASW